MKDDTSSLEKYFDSLCDRIDARTIVGMNVVFQFTVLGESVAQWCLQITKGRPVVTRDCAMHADTSLNASPDDWLDIISGRRTLHAALLTGKLKVAGDVSLALKLADVLPV